MGKVLITRHLPDGGLSPLLEAGHELICRDSDDPYTEAELIEFAGQVDGIVSHLTDKITEAVLNAGAKGSLKVVANAAVGFDNIDVRSAKTLGISVCNTPGVLDKSTADVAFLLILSASRRASEAEANLREGRWGGWGFMDHLAEDAYGKVLGLVGYGRIAKEVEKRARGFEMTVLHYARNNTGQVDYVDSLESLLDQSDIVSLHVPLTKETTSLIGKKELDRIGPLGVLINTARGPIVDENALADALESGAIYAAGLDVFDGEPAINKRLLDAPHTVFLPHIGSATTATRTKMAQLAARGVVCVLAGEVPDNLVVGH